MPVAYCAAEAVHEPVKVPVPESIWVSQTNEFVVNTSVLERRVNPVPAVGRVVETMLHAANTKSPDVIFVIGAVVGFAVVPLPVFGWSKTMDELSNPEYSYAVTATLAQPPIVN